MASRKKLSFTFEQQPTPPEGTTQEWLRPLQNAQQTVKDLVDRVNNMPGPHSVVSDRVTFTAGGQQTISHKLGQTPTRWYAEDVTGGYGVFQRLSWDERFIVLQSFDACTAQFRFE